jgi:hypothetical protein
MIQNILQKVLEELQKENPKLDYIRGMIEVLAASQEKPTIESATTTTPTTYKVTNVPTTEAEILDGQARALLGKVQGNAHVEIA